MQFGLSHIGCHANEVNHLFLASKSNQQYKYISDRGCRQCAPEKCRAEGNLLVTTNAEEKKIVKVHIQNLFLLPVLITSLGLALTGRLTEQTFTTLYSFSACSADASDFYTNSDGAQPYAGLILSGSTLYGTASSGGTNGSGTLFSLTLPGPQLTMTVSGANVILSWPTNAIGFFPQHTVYLGPAAGWVSVTLQEPPVIANGQFVVTLPNAVTNIQQFYRLSQ